MADNAPTNTPERETQLSHLKEQYNKTGNREFLKKAFAICVDNGLSLPDWVLHGIAPFITNPGLDEAARRTYR